MNEKLTSRKLTKREEEVSNEIGLVLHRLLNNYTRQYEEVLGYITKPGGEIVETKVSLPTTDFVKVPGEEMLYFRVRRGYKVDPMGDLIYDSYDLQSISIKNGRVKTVMRARINKVAKFDLIWNEGTNEPEARLESIAQFYPKLKDKFNQGYQNVKSTLVGGKSSLPL